jgi:hypothetical protein
MFHASLAFVNPTRTHAADWFTMPRAAISPTAASCSHSFSAASASEFPVFANADWSVRS